MSIPSTRIYTYQADEVHYITPLQGGDEKRVTAVKQAFDGSIIEYILDTGEILLRADADIMTHRIVRTGSLSSAPEPNPVTRDFYFQVDEYHYISLRTSTGTIEVRILGQVTDNSGYVLEFIPMNGGVIPNDNQIVIGSHRVAIAPVEEVKPAMKYPDGNPKTAFGIKKPPTWYISPYAMYQWGLAQLHGALKYGHFNWRKDPVSASTYLNAAQRHLDLFKEGEQCAKDSHVHHLAHVMACCAIIIDAEKYGTLIDDRSECKMDLDKAFEEMAETVKFLYDTWGPKQKGPEEMMANENTDKEDKKNG